MSRCLLHYFDPDFDHLHLRPSVGQDGQVDHYNLDYVQNVVKGQVLAEVRDLSPEESCPQRTWVKQYEELPPLVNCSLRQPEEKGVLARIVADKNGYAFYTPEGALMVKTVLNIRRDLDFHTGNIYFVADVVVHGITRTSFSVTAQNVLAKEVIEGADVTAELAVVAEGGVKGQGEGTVQAGRSMRLAFCENARLVAGENIVVDGVCMHTEAYVGKSMLVGDRLQGGAIYCGKHLTVKGRLGGGRSTATEVYLGEDPKLLLRLSELEDLEETLRERLAEYMELCLKGPAIREECTPRMEGVQRKLKNIRKGKEELLDRLNEQRVLERAVLLAEGEIHPGLEVNIGDATVTVKDYLSPRAFVYRAGESGGEIRQVDLSEGRARIAAKSAG